ncbi:MAG: MXAN_5187 C-terminal domain-containing protein [Trichlorobacter sp.]|jgi:enoyl-CoA hydratase/carnithine racemase
MGITEDLLIFEARLKELITSYDQYFIGLEKREPLKLLEEVEKLARRYATVPINNTMYKHRYNGLIARFSTYRQQWNRILREIEEGRYSRDRFRAKLHETERAKPSTAATAAQHQRSPHEQEIERIYAELQEASRNCHLTAAMSREQLTATIEKQRPILAQKLGTNDIQFRVVVEDGKPKIKAGLKHKKSYE